MNNQNQPMFATSGAIEIMVPSHTLPNQPKRTRRVIAYWCPKAYAKQRSNRVKRPLLRKKDIRGIGNAIHQFLQSSSNPKENKKEMTLKDFYFKIFSPYYKEKAYQEAYNKLKSTHNFIDYESAIRFINKENIHTIWKYLNQIYIQENGILEIIGDIPLDQAFKASSFSQLENKWVDLSANTKNKRFIQIKKLYAYLKNINDDMANHVVQWPRYTAPINTDIIKTITFNRDDIRIMDIVANMYNPKHCNSEDGFFHKKLQDKFGNAGVPHDLRVRIGENIRFMITLYTEMGLRPFEGGQMCISDDPQIIKTFGTYVDLENKLMIIKGSRFKPGGKIPILRDTFNLLLDRKKRGILFPHRSEELIKRHPLNQWSIAPYPLNKNGTSTQGQPWKRFIKNCMLYTDFGIKSNLVKLDNGEPFLIKMYRDGLLHPQTAADLRLLRRYSIYRAIKNGMDAYTEAQFYRHSPETMRKSYWTGNLEGQDLNKYTK